MFRRLTDAIQQSVSATVTLWILKLVIAVILVIAFGFFLAAGFIVTAENFGPFYACLIFGGFFLLLAVVVLIVQAATRRREEQRRRNLAAAAMAAPLETAAIVRRLTGGRAGPLMSLGAAGLIGLMLSGLFGRRRRRDG